MDLNGLVFVGINLSCFQSTNGQQMVLSCGSPCIQGISDPEVAANLARKVNDQMAIAISNNTARFGGFAALSMHSAEVTELGFLGSNIMVY